MDSPAALDRVGAEAVELRFVPPKPHGAVLGAQQEHGLDELGFDLAVRHPGTSLPQSPGLVLDFVPRVTAHIVKLSYSPPAARLRRPEEAVRGRRLEALRRGCLSASERIHRPRLARRAHSRKSNRSWRGPRGRDCPRERTATARAALPSRTATRGSP